jgi:hypothetical protein
VVTVESPAGPPLKVRVTDADLAVSTEGGQITLAFRGTVVVKHGRWEPDPNLGGPATSEIPNPADIEFTNLTLRFESAEAGQMGLNMVGMSADTGRPIPAQDWETGSE